MLHSLGFGSFSPVLLRRGTLLSSTIAYEDRGLITVANPKGDADDPPKNFTFDAVFAANVTQRHIYDVCAADLIEACLSGYNGTIFA